MTRSDHRFRIRYVRRQRLFSQHVHARAGGLNGHPPMLGIGRGDDYRVDTIQQFPRGLDRLDAQLVSDPIGQRRPRLVQKQHIPYNVPRSQRSQIAATVHVIQAPHTDADLFRGSHSATASPDSADSSAASATLSAAHA